MEGENAVSNIGVAAHICAAAPGGKRYNKDMTPAERKSIENCIWMCQLHAHLIDTDEIKYSVEYLKSMKAEAEKDAADAIADTSFFEKYYSHHQNHIEDLINLFDKMISDGNFDLLSNTLGTYSVSLSPEYDEIIARYDCESNDDAIRDALIQRFEYTYSLALKMLSRFINKESKEITHTMTFNQLIRTANQFGLF